MRRIITLASLVLAVTASACTPEVKASQQKMETKSICGTVDTLVAGIRGNDGYDNVTLAQIKFDDGRPLTLIGTPEVSIHHGQTYEFSVTAGPNIHGQYFLVKTKAISSCGEAVAKTLTRHADSAKK